MSTTWNSGGNQGLISGKWLFKFPFIDFGQKNELPIVDPKG